MSMMRSWMVSLLWLLLQGPSGSSGFSSPLMRGRHCQISRLHISASTPTTTDDDGDVTKNQDLSTDDNNPYASFDRLEAKLKELRALNEQIETNLKKEKEEMAKSSSEAWSVLEATEPALDRIEGIARRRAHVGEGVLFADSEENGGKASKEDKESMGDIMGTKKRLVSLIDEASKLRKQQQKRYEASTKALLGLSEAQNRLQAKYTDLHDHLVTDHYKKVAKVQKTSASNEKEGRDKTLNDSSINSSFLEDEAETAHKEIQIENAMEGTSSQDDEASIANTIPEITSFHASEGKDDATASAYKQVEKGNSELKNIASHAETNLKENPAENVERETGPKFSAVEQAVDGPFPEEGKKEAPSIGNAQFKNTETLPKEAKEGPKTMVVDQDVEEIISFSEDETPTINVVDHVEKETAPVEKESPPINYVDQAIDEIIAGTDEAPTLKVVDHVEEEEVLMEEEDAPAAKTVDDAVEGPFPGDEHLFQKDKRKASQEPQQKESSNATPSFYRAVKKYHHSDILSIELEECSSFSTALTALTVVRKSQPAASEEKEKVAANVVEQKKPKTHMVGNVGWMSFGSLSEDTGNHFLL